MKRQSLKNLTPEQRAEHKRVQNRERQQRKRERERPSRECKAILREIEIEIEKEAMSRYNWPDAELTRELQEFAEELLTRPLDVAALALATWERRNCAIFPMLEFLGYPTYEGGIERKEWLRRVALQEKWKRFGLIRLFAQDAIQRVNARDSRARHLAKEAAEAEEKGMTVEVFRIWKRHQKKVRAAAQAKAA